MSVSGRRVRRVLVRTILGIITRSEQVRRPDRRRFERVRVALLGVRRTADFN